MVFLPLLIYKVFYFSKKKNTSDLYISDQRSSLYAMMLDKQLIYFSVYGRERNLS